MTESKTVRLIMADSGDGPNTASSGKEGRNTVTDGPVTDPAVSSKVIS